MEIAEAGDDQCEPHSAREEGEDHPSARSEDVRPDDALGVFYSLRPTDFSVVFLLIAVVGTDTSPKCS